MGDAPLNPSLTQANALFAAIWPSPALTHQLCVREKRTGHFYPVPVEDITGAAIRAITLSELGHEVYFACAQYKSQDNRTASNVAAASAFWFDIDCGANKAATGKGYPVQASNRPARETNCSPIFETSSRASAALGSALLT